MWVRSGRYIPWCTMTKVLCRCIDLQKCFPWKWNKKESVDPMEQWTLGSKETFSVLSMIVLPSTSTRGRRVDAQPYWHCFISAIGVSSRCIPESRGADRWIKTFRTIEPLGSLWRPIADRWISTSFTWLWTMLLLTIADAQGWWYCWSRFSSVWSNHSSRDSFALKEMARTSPVSQLIGRIVDSRELSTGVVEWSNQ